MSSSVSILKKLDHAAKFLPQVRKLRLKRLQEQLRLKEYAAAILFDPVNIRYAVDARNMTMYHLRHPHRYLLVPAEGRPTLFETDGNPTLSEGLDLAYEKAVGVSFSECGDRLPSKAIEWAEQMAGFLKPLTSGGCKRIAVEKPTYNALKALADKGFELNDSCHAVQHARCIKVPGEVELMEASMEVVVEAVTKVKEALKPGVTENHLWAILNRWLFEYDGEWIETRLLSSGKRTNPWFQEAGMTVINAGELVGLDTDAVGPFQYCIDFSRTFLCPESDGSPAKPTAEQKDLYKYAYEQIHYNMGLIKPGMSFREFVEKAWPIPPQFLYNRYGCVAHGVGMTDEYPYIKHIYDFEYDGVIEENMVLSVESYIGHEGGKEGVKLEEQVLVTPTGAKVLSHKVPFENELLI